MKISSKCNVEKTNSFVLTKKPKTVLVKNSEVKLSFVLYKSAYVIYEWYLMVIIQPLGIKDVVHCKHAFLFALDAGSNTSQFLHLPTNPKQQTHMYAHGTDIGAGFHTNPKDAQVTVLVMFNQFAFIAGSNTKLAFDSWNEWWSLEQSSFEPFQLLGYSFLLYRFWKGIKIGDLVVKNENWSLQF